MLNNLPTQLTRFVGREQEGAHIKQLLTDARLSTLTGPGGCGETRLTIGEDLMLEQPIDLALKATQPPSVRQDDRGRLTLRQPEVVALITQGKTNGEIAEELVLSKHTVEKHVANILVQLEVDNRAEIVRWGMKQGLA
jgi:DNA-binding NarL/FixJ family response regulator